MPPTEPSPQGVLFSIGPRPQDPRPARYETVRDMRPAARDTDASGSHAAAERLQKTGIGGKQRLAVYHALRRYPGSTSAELARYMNVDRMVPARRLVELERAELRMRAEHLVMVAPAGAKVGAGLQ